MKEPKKAAARRTTRRAPHMERYVKVEKNYWLTQTGKWRVRLRVNNQTFTIEYPCDTKREGTFMADMLCIALDAIVKEQDGWSRGTAAVEASRAGGKKR